MQFSPSLLAAYNIVQILQVDYPEVPATIEAFSNGREQGFFVQNFTIDRGVAFAECRSSNQLVVYYNDLKAFDPCTHHPTQRGHWEDNWKQAKYFGHHEEREAADFIASWLRGEHQ